MVILHPVWGYPLSTYVSGREKGEEVIQNLYLNTVKDTCEWLPMYFWFQPILLSHDCKMNVFLVENSNI